MKFIDSKLPGHHRNPKTRLANPAVARCGTRSTGKGFLTSSAASGRSARLAVACPVVHLEIERKRAPHSFGLLRPNWIIAFW